MGLRPENTDRSICKKEWSAINWYLLRILNTIRYDPQKLTGSVYYAEILY